MLPSPKHIIPLIIVIIITIIYFYASSQLKEAYKRGVEDANKQQQIIQQDNEIVEKTVIIKHKNEVIKTKDFQRVITNKHNVNVAERVQISELWFAKRKDNNDQ